MPELDWKALAYVFAGSLIAAGVLTPVVMRLARRIGAVDRGGYRKINRRPLPLLGGLAVAVPLLAVCVIGALSGEGSLGQLDSNHLRLLGFGGLAILLLGVVDDIRGMRARTKFLVQFVVAGVICWKGEFIGEINIPFFNSGHFMVPPVVGGAIAVIWIVGLTNAFNLVDGVDGLAAGVGFFASIGLAIIALTNDPINTFVVILSLCLAGGLLSFLAFNFHPARIFLGDTGSMFVGFTLATVALMGCVKEQALAVFAAPILALGLPIFETLVSMARRYLRGRPLFVGDSYHTHHRLLKRGYSQRQVAAILYAVALVGTTSGVLFMLLREKNRLQWLPVGMYLTTVLGLAWMAGYLRPKEVLDKSRLRKRNLLLFSLSRYIAMSLRSGSSAMSDVELLRIARREMKLCYIEVSSEDGDVVVSSGRMRLHSNGNGGGENGDAPALVFTNGVARYADPELAARNGLEEMEVPSANGRKLTVRFQYYARPEDDDERQDIHACVAGIFEQVALGAPQPAGRSIEYAYRTQL